MTYKDARKLHNENEVTLKSNNHSLFITEVVVDEKRKSVYVLCDNGEWYHHTNIK